MSEFYSLLEKMGCEIRIPVSSIIGFSEMALGDEIPVKTKDYIGKILENAEGILRIIDNNLDMSKVESGYMEPENIPIEFFTQFQPAVIPNADDKGGKPFDIILMDTEFHKALQILFIKCNKDRYNNIIKALQEKDIKLAHRLVHSIKTAAGQLGRTSLQKAAADMEWQLRTGGNFVTGGQLRVLNLELSMYLDELYPLLVEAASNQEAYLQPLLEPEEVRELFEKLEPLLRRGNPECSKLINDLRAVEESALLIQQIEDFEFEAAQSTLAELMERMAKK